ncbi:hypothetical protein, partial [Streptomyces sp. NPDC059460]|uniref:hypothetical protein n=1 Tax=Streptomyces sp. NPDC059460 TaxID=3346840 RepID=UPI0036D1B690
MDDGPMPRLVLPPHVIKQDQAPIHQHRRLAVLRRVLHAASSTNAVPISAAVPTSITPRPPISRLPPPVGGATTIPTTPSVRVPINHPTCSGGMLVLMQGSAEPVSSVDLQM